MPTGPFNDISFKPALRFCTGTHCCESSRNRWKSATLKQFPVSSTTSKQSNVPTCTSTCSTCLKDTVCAEQLIALTGSRMLTCCPGVTSDILTCAPFTQTSVSAGNQELPLLVD